MPKGHGLAPGTMQNYPYEVNAQRGREGGKVSAVVRRAKVLDKYLKMLNEGYGKEAIKLCRRESYQAGWIKGYKRGRKFEELRVVETKGDTGE